MERFGELMIALMVIVCFIFFFGILLGAGSIDTFSWPAVFIITEVILGLLAIIGNLVFGFIKKKY